jgi:hypothetical protein
MLIHVSWFASFPVYGPSGRMTWVHDGADIASYWKSPVVNNAAILHSCMDRGTWIYVGF